MKRPTLFVIAVFMTLTGMGLTRAYESDIDVDRLNKSLNQLASDPVLGAYAQADRLLARHAIQTLGQVGTDGHAHALYIAERQVDQARVASQLGYARTRLAQLGREHDQLLLERSRIDAVAVQQELAFQRMQYQMAKEEVASAQKELTFQRTQYRLAREKTEQLKQQGIKAVKQATQARAEAERARKLAAAQSRVARAARREAELAEAAAKALRLQMLKNQQALEDLSQAQKTPAGGTPAPKHDPPHGKPEPYSGKSTHKAGQSHRS